MSFIPQPYPLFAVTVVAAQDPPRFEPTITPVRLVLGWSLDENQVPWPVLQGSPPGAVVWKDNAMYFETRELAEAAAKDFEKSARREVRHDKIEKLVPNILKAE